MYVVLRLPKGSVRVLTCWGFIYPRGFLSKKGWLCRVPMSSLKLDARRCAAGQALSNVCFSVAFSV